MSSKVLLVNLLIVLFLLGIVEAGAYFFVQEKDKDIHSEDSDYQAQLKHFEVYDPLLGWTYGPEAAELRQLDYHKGYILYGHDNMAEPDAIRVVVFGGSTSDSTLDPSPWVADFYEELKVEFGKVILFNGAVGGYNSHQELLKTIRDMHFLLPDLVISYNGANEIAKGDQFQPFVSEYELEISKKLVRSSQISFPYTLSAARILKGQNFLGLKGPFLGPPNFLSKHKQWVSNLSLMKAVAKQNGSMYHAFLQPVLGLGKYQPSERENEILGREWTAIHNPGFYIPAIAETKKYEFMTDMTEALDGLKEVYFDDCHLKPYGNKVIADQVSKLIIATYGKALKDKQIRTLTELLSDPLDSETN